MNQLNNQLEQYIACKGSKKGFLMLGRHAFYLYDNRCSPAVCQHLFIQTDSQLIETERSTPDLLFRVQNDEWTITLDSQTVSNAGRIWCLLHLRAEEDSTLRVVFYAEEETVHTVLFTDEAIEKLCLAFLRRKTYTDIPFSGEDLRELAQKQNLESLKHLTSLYLRGKPVSEISL